MLLCEMERTAWCLLSSTFQTAFAFPNLYHLGTENYTTLNLITRSAMSLLQRQHWFSKPKSTPKEDSGVIYIFFLFFFGQFGFDEGLQNVNLSGFIDSEWVAKVVDSC